MRGALQSRQISESELGIDSAEEKYTVTQLRLYATLLSARTGIPKSRIHLAWFNAREDVEVEVQPPTPC